MKRLLILNICFSHEIQKAIKGEELMDVTHETPGPRVGNILHALLEEVLDDPGKNTHEYMVNRAMELSGLSDEELEELGRAGKEKMEFEDEKEIQRNIDCYTRTLILFLCWKHALHSSAGLELVCRLHMKHDNMALHSHILFYGVYPTINLLKNTML